MATAEQFNAFVNEELRHLAEKIREVEILMTDYFARVADVYEFASANPNHVVPHAGNPPYLGTGQRMLEAHDALFVLQRVFAGDFDAGQVSGGLHNSMPLKYANLRKLCKDAPLPT